MNDLLVERHLPEPVGEADLHTIASKLMSGCLDIHRVAWHGSLLAANGRDMLCHFRGPDAESVRIALHQSGAPPGRVWRCRTQDAPDVGSSDLAHVNVVVSHEFDEPAEFGARQMAEDVDMGCFKIHRVRLVRSHLSLDGLRMVCLYEAPDAESVRQVQRRDGLPPDRIWAVRRYAP